MELRLTGETTIGEVKKQFSNSFTHLKIEFFHHGHGKEQSSLPDQKIRDWVHLGSLPQVRRQGNFVFAPCTTVADFEQRIQDEFGLPVQVYRKAGNVWIETVQTDNLSLQKQNSIGHFVDRPASLNSNQLFL